MRPLRLDLAGFTVFREPTTVDLTDAEFFVLLGPTGSGKSTVLDAICFALYGTVPRWDDRRAIANALAPSAAEARVRLVFSAAGQRYVATRVVRRDGKGKVSTAHAGLEKLPAGFDLSALDGGLDADDLGEVLAGTPAEMEAAVTAAVGLPYEQFVTCVILPQGAFAEFLHAKPAKRQDILVNLLGLRVYKQIGERAGLLAKDAEAAASAVSSLLGGLADATAEAVAEAAERVDELDRLTVEVGDALPRLAQARQQAHEARDALAALDDEGRRLAAVRAPADAGEIADAVVTARTAADRDAEAVLAAENEEDELRGRLADAGEPGELRRLVDGYAEADRLTAEVEELAAAAAGGRDELTAAQRAVTVADAEVEEAEAALRAAQDADLAGALRPHLSVGEDCPVCAQPVAELPPAVANQDKSGGGLAAAGEALAAAKQRHATADRAARELDRAVHAAEARAGDARRRLGALAELLDGQPALDTLTAQLAEIEATRAAVQQAGSAVKTARERARRSRAGAESAERTLRTAWQALDRARDSVAAFGPPAADRDDLVGTWQALADWAAAEAQARRVARADRAAAVAEADATADSVYGKLAALLGEHGIDLEPESDPARVVAVAVERATGEHRRAVERYEQAAQLRGQRDEHLRRAQVAKALANHLRANNFERWLLTEALDRLVDGASTILRELSGGQYELVHDKGEFAVVDHHDAALRRPVRTLSGGETFQASLALALALSEQLAGMSTVATSLESIMLDEGFGTLDPATLDTVAATLENLAARGDRIVGVVTHVAALAERIPVRYEVSKQSGTARIERTTP